MTVSPMEGRDALAERVELYEGMLRRCRAQFAKYAENHRAKAAGLNPATYAKAIEDTLAKADVNEALAHDIDLTLGDATVSGNLT